MESPTADKKMKALTAMNDSYKDIIVHLEAEKSDIDYKIRKFKLIVEMNNLKMDALIDTEIKNKIVSE